MKTSEERFWEKVDIRGENECWNWLAGKNGNGYGRFRVKERQRTASRVAWELTNGEIPEGMEILHHCDNPACCNPKCLFLGTPADNMADKSIKGRSSRVSINVGSSNGRAKLNEIQVMEIRNLCQNGMSGHELIDLYKVSSATISNICSRKRWKNI